MELDVKQLVMAIRQIAEEKNLPEDAVQDVIEQSLAAAYRKDFGDREQDVRAMLNTKTGDLTIVVTKIVVDTVENDAAEITLADAKKQDPKAEIDGTVEFTEHPKTFGRVAAQTAKQVILQKLREAEREIILGEYEDKIGSVLTGVVQRVEARVVRVDLGKATGIMPASEQIQGEFYSSGARVKVYLKDVERTARGPQLILSRGNEAFVEHMFRSEVPEMENGAVEIKAIAREAGVRTKLAVASTVPGVDPVGTFVGGHGTRVQAVMSEIGDREKIDIITFSEDLQEFIKNALSPTEVATVTVDEENKKAVVAVPEDQLSIAIGKGGQNVRLASRLVGYDIDIQSAGGEKVADEAAEAPEGTPVAASTPPKPKKLKGKKEIEASLLDAIESSD